MEDTGLPTRLQQLGGDRGRLGQRLLADDVLAGSRRGQHDLPVQHGWQAGDHEVDVVGQDTMPVLLHALVPKRPARLGRQRPVHVGDDGQTRADRRPG